MIHIPRLEGQEQERLHAEYLVRLIRSGAINFGCSELKQYIERKYPFLSTDSLEFPKLGENIQETEERFFLKKNPSVYCFLFPNDELRVENLVWLLIGIHPTDPCSTIRDSLERLIHQIEQKQVYPISEKRQKEISSYWIRFDRLRAGLMDENTGEKEDTAYWLQRCLGLRTCPYCNANYTIVSAKGRFRADLEHFFPKSKYPYLSVTLYNLFPSCPTCNKLKGDFANVLGQRKPFQKWPHATEILFPYDESFNQSTDNRAVFRVIPQEGENPMAVYAGESKRFNVALVPTTKDDSAAIMASDNQKNKIQRWIEKCGLQGQEQADPLQEESTEHIYWKRVLCAVGLLELEDVYDFHRPEVQRIIQDYHIYQNLTAIQERAALIPLAGDSQRNLDAVEKLARRTLFFADIEPESWANMPLNKLKADILEQLDELKALGIQKEII